MKVLVINAGSSSCKYQLIEMIGESVLCSGLVERIGDPSGGLLAHKIFPGTEKEKTIKMERAFATHVEGMEEMIRLLTDSQDGVIKDKADISAIGHRVVHGGEAIARPTLIDEKAKQIIRDNFIFAPLHNPANLMGIEVAEKLFPGAPNVGVFDTEFSMSMKADAFMYPLPYDLYEGLRIRRYGFHGTSHKYVARKTAQFLGKKPEEINNITCHLGNGCSMTAVRGGVCIDTSMGLTPLEGLMMGTRCGSIDPAIVPFVMEKKGLSASEIDNLMNKKSGLLGICGSNDMRDVHDRREKGDKKAQLAFDMVVWRVKKQIGAYMAVLGRVDAVVFTAGIGENDAFLREQTCLGMEELGIVLDVQENRTRKPGAREISKAGSRVKALIIPTNEELEIAQSALQALGK
ncbi:MAG: acetate kinase [Deltaproteobacteria bacterium]|jgi:acetate kinase|nr:acetate kinase [Deltaproteobacteria bacterium]